jgi:tRNA1Val (adenine37-N6)-methyltransferase
MMPSDSFSFKRFSIQQESVAMPLTMDACILGAYVQYLNPSTICDIGSGTGILSLMMAQRYPDATIDAIEIDTPSSKQASINVKNSPWAERIKVFNMDIHLFQQQYPNKYDLIICNPPYYKNQLPTPDPRSNLARHGTELTVTQLIDLSNTLLKNSGILYFILPIRYFEEMDKYAISQGLYVNDLMYIRNMEETEAKRFIAGLSMNKKNAAHSTLTIKTVDGEYTEHFKSLLKDFYQAF